MKNKKVKIILVIIIVIAIIIAIMYSIDYSRMKNGEEVVFSTWGKKYSAPLKEKTENVTVALTLEDKIVTDAIWCGTFQLIWNDLKNNLAKQDIVFNPQIEVVEHLNMETFKEEDLTDKYYYKKIGTPSLELKREIEKAIKDKFNEKSDILNEFIWENRNLNDYFLYVMLKKEFKFEKEFEELEKGDFGDYRNVEYFGINKNSDKEALTKQVKVLYYNNSDDFAIKLITKQEDEVILCKDPKGETFNEIYQNMKSKEKIYKDSGKSTTFNKVDMLKIPNIQINSKNEFEEIQNKPFYFSNGEEYMIEKAMQTIQFSLDKSGGEVKSEAAMMIKYNSAVIYDEIREFIVDDTFAIFLKEEGKQNPYFAGKIDDISKFQTKNNEITKQEQDKVVEMYKTMIDELMNSSTGLNGNAKYISLDIDSLKAPNPVNKEEYLQLNESQKQQLLSYCKKYNENIKDSSFEELEEQGLVTKDFPSIEGILIYVNDIEKLTENKAVLKGIKYRSGLGALFVEYELKYKNGKWDIEEKSVAVS